jgi:hypothetical protein
MNLSAAGHLRDWVISQYFLCTRSSTTAAE